MAEPGLWFEITATVPPDEVEAVAELMRGRTTVIVAHRLSTLHAVDRIAVFEHGRIVEYGARDDLVGDDDSRFAQLLELSAGQTAGQTAGRTAAAAPTEARG